VRGKQKKTHIAKHIILPCPFILIIKELFTIYTSQKSYITPAHLGPQHMNTQTTPKVHLPSIYFSTL